MKQILRYLIAAGVVTNIIFVSCSVKAESSEWFYTKSIAVGSTGNLYLYPETGVSAVNPSGCNFNHRYSLPSDHIAYDRLYSLLIAAHYSGDLIKVNVLDDACSADSPKISVAYSKP